MQKAGAWIERPRLFAATITRGYSENATNNGLLKLTEEGVLERRMRRGQGPETKIWYRVKPSEAKDYTKFIDKYVGVVAGMLKNNGVVIDSKDPEDVVQTIARKGMLGYVLKGAQVQSKRFGIPSIHSASKADPQLA